ncbi:eukaryotic translation initiation factor 3 subunit I [Strongylocentrotus purpuratus]|uniref:Eukaryotic translation initiation factor 3 subunit I n=1 Tax=Strongylocentrotus purpuratus TaxID=7668 RepID=A0A7M7SX65_STRPU|nr:eukaryotic translation initiation factor 3 subunit I [Strongylocentrotus purpuratus]
MKPIALFGHERSVTQIKYNREGDLLFSTAKDTTPNIWYSVNGERLGTFEGHSGAVWCIDVDWESQKAITGSADNTMRMWDIKTGKCTTQLEYKSAVRTCGYSYSSNIFFTSTDRTMGQTSDLCVYDLRDPSQIESNNPFMRLPMDTAKITSGIWTFQDTAILTGHENGELTLWDIKMQDCIGSTQDIHQKAINDIQKHSKYDMIVTASKDCTAKLVELPDLVHMKTFKTERPVNSAAISPIKNHVLLGGGQEAMDVTTTSGRIGKFDARFYHAIFEEEFGRVKGHFGPINSVAFHPDGMGYSSGGEDGYVRVHSFDPNYFEFEFEY